jgi:hypothetical protein
MKMNIDELFALPFHEYMARRTKYAVDRMQRDNLIDPVYAGIALLQATWAREYWFNKVQGESK